MTGKKVNKPLPTAHTNHPSTENVKQTINKQVDIYINNHLKTFLEINMHFGSTTALVLWLGLCPVAEVSSLYLQKKKFCPQAKTQSIFDSVPAVGFDSGPNWFLTANTSLKQSQTSCFGLQLSVIIAFTAVNLTKLNSD